MSDFDLKQYLLDRLKLEVLTIEFEKADGSTRVMKCTLQEQFLPEETSTSTKKHSDDTITVWDIEANGWRCVRLDRVTIY